MRNSSLIKSRFFMAGTGRKLLSEHGHRVAFTALYLTACPHSHMSGVYYLPPGTAAHELCVTVDQFLADLAVLEAEGFARYDRESCVVWVVSMMRHQVAEAWKVGDTRVKTIRAHLEALPASPLIGEHRLRYRLTDGASDATGYAPSDGVSDVPYPTSSAGARDAPCRAPTDGGPNPLPVPNPSPPPPEARHRTRIDTKAEILISRPRVVKLGGAL